MEVSLDKAPKQQVLDFDKYHHLQSETRTFNWVE